MPAPKIKVANDGVWFHCLGCNDLHRITNSWEISGHIESPTIKPSILVRSKHKGKDTVCHSYVTNGRIEYLNDSTHHLSGKEVELPPIEEYM